jgi:hypothetical protein
MTVIDLLNKIANGEEVPKKIKYDDEIFIYDNQIDKYWNIDNTNNLYDILSRFVGIALNDEVEVIEEDKKIEKIDVNYLQTIKKWKRAKILGSKINEIIDVINKGDE